MRYFFFWWCIEDMESWEDTCCRADSCLLHLIIMRWVTVKMLHCRWTWGANYAKRLSTLAIVAIITCIAVAVASESDFIYVSITLISRRKNICERFQHRCPSMV